MIIELENGGVVQHAYLSNSNAEFAHIPSRADQGVVLAIKDEQWATWWVMRWSPDEKYQASNGNYFRLDQGEAAFADFKRRVFDWLDAPKEVEVWSLTIDGDDPTIETEVFPTVEDANAALRKYAEVRWDDEVPEGEDEFDDFLSQRIAWYGPTLWKVRVQR
jgi:hypothetical protein